MKQVFAAIFVSLSGLLGGCAAFQDKWHTKTVQIDNRGAEPVDFEAQIKAYFAKTLKDPFSAVYDFKSKPFKSSYSINTVTQWPTLINVNGYQTTVVAASWQVDLNINAKNSYGAYTGWKRYQVHFANNTVVYSKALPD